MRKTESIKDPNVRKKYAGQYVARLKNHILVHAKKGSVLFRQLDKKGIDPTKVVIDFIPQKDALFSLHAC